MKTKYLFFLTYVLSFLSCCSRNTHEFIYIDESHIDGQLGYTANPFASEKDTILCLNNVYIAFSGYDADYCSDVRNLLSLFGGKFTDCRLHNFKKHDWEYLAESKQCFYPICNGRFVSLIDPNTGLIADVICLNDRLIYPKLKRNENGNQAPLAMGDFVSFLGSDYMNPIFIADSITLSGDKIICFDGQRGPFDGEALHDER